MPATLLNPQFSLCQKCCDDWCTLNFVPHEALQCLYRPHRFDFHLKRLGCATPPLWSMVSMPTFLGVPHSLLMTAALPPTAIGLST